MEYLQRADILLINKMTVEAHGGNFVPPENLLNEGSLDYVLEAVQAEISGQKLHRTASEVAAVYCYHIIANHTFQDGNKRTGLGAALLFLRMNGLQLHPAPLFLPGPSATTRIPAQGDGPSDLLFEFIMEVASAQHELATVKKWMEANVTPRAS